MNFDIFDDYKEINLQIINSLKEDREDVILFEKREEIIKHMFSLDLDKSEIKKIYKEKNLESLDKELENDLKEKMKFIKMEIKKITIGQEANNAYQAINRNSSIFTKRI